MKMKKTILTVMCGLAVAFSHGAAKAAADDCMIDGIPYASKESKGAKTNVSSLTPSAEQMMTEGIAYETTTHTVKSCKIMHHDCTHASYQEDLTEGICLDNLVASR